MISTNNLLDIDELQIYFGYPFHINDVISIKSPTVGDIIEFGERQYYSMVHMLTCIPSDMKSQLYDSGIDYEELADFELFIMLTRNLTKEKTSILLGELDLSQLEIEKNNDNGELILHGIYEYKNEEGNSFNKEVIIDKYIYMKMVEFIRTIHNIKPKVEKAANKTTKRILIDLDRQKIAKASKEPYKSQLKDLVSAMMRYPGFKYKSNELKEITLFEFMDTVQGAQIYLSSTALLQGSYSGMIDTSKISKDEFNWMRSITN